MFKSDSTTIAPPAGTYFGRAMIVNDGIIVVVRMAESRSMVDFYDAATGDLVLSKGLSAIATTIDNLSGLGADGVLVQASTTDGVELAILDAQP